MGVLLTRRGIERSLHFVVDETVEASMVELAVVWQATKPVKNATATAVLTSMLTGLGGIDRQLTEGMSRGWVMGVMEVMMLNV